MAKRSKYQQGLPWHLTLLIGAVLGYIAAAITLSSRPQLDETYISELEVDSIPKRYLTNAEDPEENQNDVLSASITIIILLLVVLTLVFERVKEAVEESAERIFEPVIEGLVRQRRLFIFIASNPIRAKIYSRNNLYMCVIHQIIIVWRINGAWILEHGIILLH